MSAEESNQNPVEDTSDSIIIPISEILRAIWQRRRWLTIVTAIGMVLAAGYAFLIPNEYTSTAKLMPPDQSALSGTSMLTALGGSGALMPAVGGFMSSRTPGETFIGVLMSETAEDDIIKRFDLRSVYHCKFYIDARAKLSAQTTIAEDKKSGIISISMTDRDPSRAREIAKAYVEELNKLVNTESTSSARRERIFLEERLKSIKDELDSSSNELSQFSSRNGTFDPQSQGQSMLGEADRLQAELITAEADLSGLKAMYTEDNVKVRQARATVDELQSQLQKMSGTGEHANAEPLKAGQFQPSMRKLPLLGATYADIARRVKVEEALYETLTKQYELAKVQEAKEIPSVKVLDEPQVPEKKSSPHRAIITVIGIVIAAFAGIVWVVVRKLWELKIIPFPLKRA